MSQFLRLFLIGAFLTTTGGCASGLGNWFPHDQTRSSAELSTTRPQIERGTPRPMIDGIGWVVGIPSKIILWDRRIDNHKISPETESAITQYISDLDLCDTKVRLNQYAPFDEWRRLNANRTVGWGWRYTLGVLAWADEAIFPGRIFGGDRYNAYTNTISIYSDAPSVAVKEGSRARDIRSRSLPGTYAAVNSMPLISMWHETVATGYAMEYLQDDLPKSEREGYYLLYPSYGAHLGTNLASFTAVPNTVSAAIFAIPGHIVGRYEGNRVNDSRTMLRAQDTSHSAHEASGNSD